MATQEESETEALMHMLLITEPASAVAKLFDLSPQSPAIREVLCKLRPRTVGKQWFRTVVWNRLMVAYWTRARKFSRTTDIQAKQINQIGQIAKIQFATALRSDVPIDAAVAWDSARGPVHAQLEYAIRLGCDANDIFRALEQSTQQAATGCHRIEAYVRAVLGCERLMCVPALACDTFMYQCDMAFSRGVEGFSRDAASMQWSRMRSRPPGSDLVELDRELTTAFVQKLDDKAITVSNVWDYPAHQHEINSRMIEILDNDLSNPARGSDNAMAYSQELEERRSAVNAGRQPSSILSCVEICNHKLNPYEQSRSRLHAGRSQPPQGINAAMSPAAPQTSSYARLPPSHSSALGSASTSASTSTTPPAQPTDASYANLPAAGGGGGGGGTRPGNERPTNGARAREASHPNHGGGLPPYANADTWTGPLWKRVRFNPQRTKSILCSDGKTPLHENAAFLAAYARVYPSSAAMTHADLTDPHSDNGFWRPGSCAFCTHRPRPPPGTPADQQWRYGTGDGAHNPIICQNVARFICEGCCGEVDERVVPLLQRLISLKRVDGPGTNGRK